MKMKLKLVWDGWLLGMCMMAILTRWAMAQDKMATFGWQGWSYVGLVAVIAITVIIDLATMKNKETK